jgi:hypothetical protein
MLGLMLPAALASAVAAAAMHFVVMYHMQHVYIKHVT